MCLIRVGANSAGQWPSRTKVSQPWCSVVSYHVLHGMRFYSVLNFKKHFFSAVKQRCTLHFLHITLGVPLHMQNKIKKIWKPDKSLLYTFIYTHTHTHIFLCTVHVILNKITKANNLAFFSHHVLLWPCVRTGCPTFKWCLIVTPTPYWTVLWYFWNILIGCNHLKKHALNMGHKKNFPLPEGNTMQ